MGIRVEGTLRKTSERSRGQLGLWLECVGNAIGRLSCARVM
jgi:hypothetical protein